MSENTHVYIGTLGCWILSACIAAYMVWMIVN